MAGGYEKLYARLNIKYFVMVLKMENLCLQKQNIVIQSLKSGIDVKQNLQTVPDVYFEMLVQCG